MYLKGVKVLITLYFFLLLLQFKGKNTAMNNVLLCLILLLSAFSVGVLKAEFGRTLHVDPRYTGPSPFIDTYNIVYKTPQDAIRKATRGNDLIILYPITEFNHDTLLSDPMTVINPNTTTTYSYRVTVSVFKWRNTGGAMIGWDNNTITLKPYNDTSHEVFEILASGTFEHIRFDRIQLVFVNITQAFNLRRNDRYYKYYQSEDIKTTENLEKVIGNNLFTLYDTSGASFPGDIEGVTTDVPKTHFNLTRCSIVNVKPPIHLLDAPTQLRLTHTVLESGVEANSTTHIVCSNTTTNNGDPLVRAIRGIFEIPIVAILDTFDPPNLQALLLTDCSWDESLHGYHEIYGDAVQLLHIVNHHADFLFGLLIGVIVLVMICLFCCCGCLWWCCCCTCISVFWQGESVLN